MSFKELKNKTAAELSILLTEKRKALWDFRFGTAGGKAKNVKEGAALRKEIARIMTARNSEKKTT